MAIPALVLDSLDFHKSVSLLPDQCSQVMWEMFQQPIPPQCDLVSNIVITGMGGSALPGRVISGLERQTLKIPVVVSTEYHLPNFVDEKTLVVTISYSGNTEETIAALSEARARNAQIFIIASGGKLAEISKNQNLPGYIFNPKFNPSGQPRMGLGYSVSALTLLLLRCQLIHPLANYNQLPDFLRQEQSKESQYQLLAKELSGKMVVIITSEHLKGAAHCFKNQLNENSKNFSVLFDIPELNHHLLEGLAYPASNRSDLHFLFLQSKSFHPELAKRYQITADVLKKQHITSSSVNIAGPNRIFEAMNLIQMGGYVSYFLSQLNGIDPGPIPWVNFFKDNLSSAH